tara:strand:- start:38 stop:331 length:294 start_codon:yes stop_codon:yes gene_type:complete
MGAYKQKMLEEMEDEDHTDEYGASMDNDESGWDFEDACEERAIEKSIDDDLQDMRELEADLSSAQKKMYNANTNKNMMVKERISLLKSILKGEEYDG